MLLKKTPFLLLMLFVSCHVFFGPDSGGSPQEIFDTIWNDFNITYALFDVKGIDWDEIYNIYAPQIQPDMNNLQLFQVLSDKLGELQDAHVSLRTPFNREVPSSGIGGLFVTAASRLQNGGTVAGGANIVYGTFVAQPNVGYMYIGSFLPGKVDIGSGPVQPWAREIDGILRTLAHTDAIILDIRSNSGGLGSNAEYIGSRFTATSSDYIRVYTKNGPGRNDFSAPQTWTVRPASTSYTNPVFLLTDNRTNSAAERFTLALRTQAHVTHVGGTTRGALSARIVRPLVNGWEYTMSVQKVTDMQGNYHEGTGIIPDVPLSEPLSNQLDYILSLW